MDSASCPSLPLLSVRVEDSASSPPPPLPSLRVQDSPSSPSPLLLSLGIQDSASSPSPPQLSLRVVDSASSPLNETENRGPMSDRLMQVDDLTADERCRTGLNVCLRRQLIGWAA